MATNINLIETEQKLLKALSFDLSSWDRVKKELDLDKYSKTYIYINRLFSYQTNKIFETSVRQESPFLARDIVYFPSTHDEKFAHHEVLYQMLCAELYFIVVSIRRADSTYSIRDLCQSLNYSESVKALKSCWLSINNLYANYYESYEKFKGMPRYEIICSTQMSSTFNSVCQELKDYLSSRPDIDTRSTEQKVVDATKSGIESILTFFIGMIFLITVILLMAKCCGADVHPFG